MAPRYDPFERMNRLFEQTRRSMVDAGMAPALGSGLRSDGLDADGSETNAALKRTDEGFAAVADLPGFEDDQLDIRFEDGVLSIRGESEQHEEGAGHSRRRSRRVHERLTVPGDVIEEEISASYRNGVLEVLLPVADEADEGSHRIDIN